MNRFDSEAGTALIWFIALMVFVSTVALVLVSAIDQYLFVRSVTDFADQFAVACKSLLLTSSNKDLSSISASLISRLGDSETWVKSATLEQGSTVKIIVCSNWSSPVDLVQVSRTICEQALAR
ncbi:MAG: hypothetical protein EBS85_02585 [Micrococcales bacterium]|nr:hypothetical protein [Actinomycetota bacterium]NCA07600.1 hypothetical protein [Micrococcales bacterium]